MKPAKTQQDTTMNFDGMESIAPRHTRRYAHNQWSGHSNDGREVNFGRGPTRGNQGYHVSQGGRSVTGDPLRTPPAAAVPALPTQGSVRDAINRGSQVRTPGGTRSWDPQKGQNYRGDPDHIRIGQTGGTAYGATTRGSRPVAPGSTEGINYGPKSQY